MGTINIQPINFPIFTVLIFVVLSLSRAWLFVTQGLQAPLSSTIS